MNEIRLLDCTLRDGGYINDWKFGYHTIQDIIRKLIDSGVDYIEIGFLRNCDYSKDAAVYNCCAEIQNVLPENRGNAMFTAMALHNKYDINKLEDYDGKSIDALRVTFHDYDIDEGLSFIEKAMRKGYKVFCNPINIMGYSDEMILDLIHKVNRIKPYGFSIVDTFGSMMKEDLMRIYSLVEHNLDPSVTIGLHLHENLGLSYSLAQEFLAMKAAGRNCVIDGSLLGMGRSPGNLCMELIMDYMNKTRNASYDVNPILDGIDDHIAKLKAIEPWGYNTAYALSAKYNLHRNYAEFLLNKGRLRAKHINQILASIRPEKKTTYDEAYVQKLYEDHQNHTLDDTAEVEILRSELSGKNILILAPGASLLTQKEKIEEYIKERNPVIISANFVSDAYAQDYVFCSNEMRYDTVKGAKTGAVKLITSNLKEEGIRDRAFDYTDLSYDELGGCDNCVIMLLKLMVRLGIKEVSLAGFDGYKGDSSDYVHTYMASQYTKGMEENVRIRKYVKELRKKIQLQFLTGSEYID